MLTRKKPAPPDPNSPGRLAAEFSRAQAEFQTRRANIIERGTTRQREIEALMETLHKERSDLAAIVSTAAKADPAR